MLSYTTVLTLLLLLSVLSYTTVLTHLLSMLVYTTVLAQLLLLGMLNIAYRLPLSHVTKGSEL